jgi:hypothetical protein
VSGVAVLGVGRRDHGHVVVALICGGGPITRVEVAGSGGAWPASYPSTPFAPAALVDAVLAAVGV